MKILFALSQLHCGGIEKSALSLLSVLVSQGHSVRLMLTRKEGEFLDDIPAGVEVEEVPFSSDVRYEMTYGRKALLCHFIRRLSLAKAIHLLWEGWRMRKLSADARALMIAERFCATLPPDETVYDWAIDFSEFTEIYYVANCVKAKRKAIWLHTELSEAFSSIQVYTKYLRMFDVLYAVSQALVASVKHAIPELASCVKYYQHIVDGTLVRALAQREAVEWDCPPGATRILSVGRLARQKGFDLIPSMVARLIDKGHQISWIILGEGSERVALQRDIERMGLAGAIKLLGVKKNPYPYYAACDIYVQPSRYEGYCLTLADARMLYKPIVTTDFNGAREQLKDGVTGYIVPFDETAIESRIETLIQTPTIGQTFSQALKQEEHLSTKEHAFVLGE